MNMLCWHRPGVVRGVWVTCRHCGVAIERCPCAGEYERKVNSDCVMCGGSTWVSFVRSAKAMFASYLEDRV